MPGEVIRQHHPAKGIRADGQAGRGSGAPCSASFRQLQADQEGSVNGPALARMQN